MHITRRILGLVCLLALEASPALACFDIDTSPASFVWFTSATTAEVAVEGAVVKTAGINPGDYCGVGLGHSNTLITAITALAALDDADPTAGPVALPGLAFTTNATTSGDFTTASPGQIWQGFHSSVGTAIPGGTYAAMVFSITVPGGTTYQDIIDELQDFAFLGADDANAAGNLNNTNQEIEGIVGVTELPYCYDDVLDPGEVCDGYSNMGCGIGQTCLECSQCITGNLANACKADIIRDIGFNSKNKLKCYAKAAKLGMAVDPNCLNAVTDLSLIWPKYTSSCPQTLPSPGTMTSYVDSLNNNLVTLLPLGGSTGAWKCASKKFKASSLRAVNSIKCYSKAYDRNLTVDPNCLIKVNTKFQTKFTQAETPGMCDAGNVGNAGSVATAVDQFVNPDVVGNIPPP